MQKTWKPVAGGVLAIASGCLTLLIVLAAMAFMIVPASRMSALGVGVLGLVFIVLSIVAIVGGIFAIQRRHWGMSLAGAICAIISPWSLLGIVATVFIAISREEFPGASSSTGIS